MKVCLECEQAFSSIGWICPACGYEPVQMDGFVAHAAALSKCSGGFKPEYFSELAKLEEHNFWFRARNKLILWALNTYKPNAHSFLEVGCGTGFVLSGMAKAHPEMALSGSEIFLTGLSHAAKRFPAAHFMQMDARRVPFTAEFEAIGAFDVLEHIEEDETVLDQLYRALKSGGILLLTVPQHPWLWSSSDEYACHVRRYTHSEIRAKVKRSGFEILRSSSFVTLLLPAMMLSRELQKRKKGAFNPSGELSINPVLNRAFYGLMMLELLGVKLGLNYPVGGSRIIVARKVA